MAKFVNDTILDQALNYVKSNVSRMDLCTGQPSTFTDATGSSTGTGHSLGNVAMSSGDITVADGDTSGRKLTVAQTTGLTVTVTSTAADHIALTSTGNSELLIVTTITTRSVTTGDVITVPAFDEEILDAS